MITLFDSGVRNFNNTSLSTDGLILSDFVDISTLADIRLRVEIVTILTAGASMLIEYDLDGKGSGSLFADAVGHYEIGFHRSDLNPASFVVGSFNINGRIRLQAWVVAFAQGEDVPEWPPP